MKKDQAAWCWGLSQAYIGEMNRKRWTLPSLYCSAQELAGFYHCPNLVFYHPGRHQARLLQGLARYERVICNVGDPCLLDDGKQQAAKARAFSRLSKRFPNIVGAIVDDFSTAAVEQNRLSPAIMKATYAALKSSNPSLQLMCVVYSGHIEKVAEYSPYFDVVNLWIWKASDLKNVDRYLRNAQRVFPGKPIHLGLYLYDYGGTCDTLPLDLVRFELKRARQYVNDGRIEGFHLLGSYLKQELLSKQARWVAGNLANAL
jgi:hypothetical protein